MSPSPVREGRGHHKLKTDMHECPAPGCTENVDRNRLACPKHWRRVPKALRDELWDAFREGMGRPRHTKAVVACVQFLRGES